MCDVIHVPIKLEGDMAHTLETWESFTPILDRVIEKLESLPSTDEDCLTLELKVVGTTVEEVYSQVRAYYVQQQRFETGLDIVAQVAAGCGDEDRKRMNIALSHILDVVDVGHRTRCHVSNLVDHGLTAMGLGQRSPGDEPL